MKGSRLGFRFSESALLVQGAQADPGFPGLEHAANPRRFAPDTGPQGGRFKRQAGWYREASFVPAFISSGGAFLYSCRNEEDYPWPRKKPG